MTGLLGRSATTRAATLVSSAAMLAALAALPAGPAWRPTRAGGAYGRGRECGGRRRLPSRREPTCC